MSMTAAFEAASRYPSGLTQEQEKAGAALYRVACDSVDGFSRYERSLAKSPVPDGNGYFDTMRRNAIIHARKEQDAAFWSVIRAEKDASVRAYAIAMANDT
jgi:hypothetical protein